MTADRCKYRFSLMLCAILLSAQGVVLSADTMSAGIHADIVYGQAVGENLLLDAYVPQGEGRYPVVILVHGGGWVGGDKQDMSFLAEPLTQAGFVCFSIGYRLAPAHRWPACLDDVRTAIHWVKAHAAEYRGNPDKIALAGYSAGGHLACMAAVHEPMQAVIGIAPPTDHLADSTRRGGVSECMQKLLDRSMNIDAQSKVLLNQISPINYVSSNLPPYLLIHGTVDQSVPYEQSINFMAKLKAHHVPCELITIEGAPHRISEWDKFGVDYRQEMAGWLWRTLNDGQRQFPSPDMENRVITVSADGKGDFTTVQAAVDAVEEYNAAPTEIAIKPGTYKEKITVPRSKRFVKFQGQDPETTVLTFDLYAGIKDETGKEIGTFRTPSVTIEADDFSAENITFENTAGDVGQAVAVTVIGDRIVFRNCRFLGWQDTLLDQTGRHYYENCYIAGHCDFIFGGGIAFFEKCQIHCLSASYITAASTPEHQPYGYVFSDCKITGEPEGSKTYLGRPWRDYASVVFLNTEMSNIVRPEGWHNWSKPHREKTAFYAEYNSIGPGANPTARMDWSYQLTDKEADKYTLEKVLSGDDEWNPVSGTVQSSLEVKSATAEQAAAIKKKIAEQAGKDAAYLFVCSGGIEKNELFLVTSTNGFEWIQKGGAFLYGQAGLGKQFIAPSLIQGPKEIFHLVWQTAVRGDAGFGYASSADLIHWSEQCYFDLMDKYDAYDLVSPVVYKDPSTDGFIITWASTLPGNYYQAYQEDVEDNPRLWYTVTRDFQTFEPAKPFFEPGYSVRKGCLFQYNDCYALVHEDSRNSFQTLRTAFGRTSLGPWTSITNALPLAVCRNPSVLRISDETIVYFDGDGGNRGALITQDFKTWTDISDFVSFPAGYGYGNAVKVSVEVVEKIKNTNPVSVQNESDNRTELIAPIDAPFTMPQLKRPVFKDCVVDIRQQGAVADGQSDNTKAFAAAIELCAGAGGGRVLVPEGRWLTGPIHLKSNIELHLAEGAEIVFSDRFKDYLPVVPVRVGGIEIYNYSPLIYARDCENIAITGPGKLNGNAKTWWSWKARETKAFFEMAATGVPVEKRVFGTPEAAIRPSFLCLMNCRNILLEGFTIGSGPNWTIHPVYCENIIIRRVNVITDGPNNDGIDPDSCKNVLIEHCLFDTGDDCVVLKSGYNEDGWRVGRPTENVVMRYCSSKRGHGGLVIGSEMSGDVRNVYMHDCTFEGTDRAVRVKSRRGRGGVVENVWVRSIKMKDMQREAVIFNMEYSSDKNEARNEKPPVFRNFDIRNLTCQGAPMAVLMRALEDSPIENVHFEDMTITSKQGVICENVKNIVFDHVSITPQQGPVYRITNGRDVTIRSSTVPEGTEVLLEAAGAVSSDICILDCDISSLTEAVVIKDGAAKEAVYVE